MTIANLYDYLKEDYDRHVIDHAFRVDRLTDEGTFLVYIHPSSVDGKTLYFEVFPTGEVKPQVNDDELEDAEDASDEDDLPFVNV